LILRRTDWQIITNVLKEGLPPSCGASSPRKIGHWSSW